MRTLASAFAAFSILMVLAFTAAAGVYFYYARGLPDHTQLETYEPPVATRVYAGDGRLLAEFATEKRVFVPIGVIPSLIVDAFLAAEDKNFFRHPGIDPLGIVRAAVTNVRNLGSGRRPSWPACSTRSRWTP